MSDINPERILEGEKQNVSVNKEYGNSLILDVGGGGEGIISKLYGRNVVAIDRILRELEETTNDAIKIVMDACDMKFIGNTFDVTTIFFTLMYMKREEQEKAISEVFRVLKPGGILDIWDVNIPIYDGGKKDLYVVRLNVNLPDEIISTGYGRFLNDRGQQMSDIIEILKTNGFEIVESKYLSDIIFKIKCKKPE